MAGLGSPVEELARELGVLTYRVADRGLIPRELALRAVSALDLEDEVDLNSPSHQILAGVFEATGHLDGLRSLEASDLDGATTALIDVLREFAAPRHALWEIDPAPAPAGPVLARSKADAVQMISDLTGSGPELLGPGSKERRSVLENLHRGLGFGEPPAGATKPELGERLVRRLGGRWDSSCWSTGSTVTLVGLNRILTLASAFRARQRRAPHPAREALGLVEHLAGVLGAHGPVWDGRASVEEMVRAGFRHARQTEWPGWYFEFLAIEELIEEFSGGPVRIGAVEFDYHRHYPWDLKTHSAGRDDVPLNDRRAVDEAVRIFGGLGVIILHGQAEHDGEHEFWTWHSELRKGRALTPDEQRRAPGSRQLKTSFTPTHLEALWIDEAALDSPALAPFNQGRQSDGSPRRGKYRLDLRHASGMRLALAEL